MGNVNNTKLWDSKIFHPPTPLHFSVVQLATQYGGSVRVKFWKAKWPWQGNLSFLIKNMRWAPWISQVQRTALLSIFAKAQFYPMLGIPESGKILLLESKIQQIFAVESGILGFGIWNTAQGFRTPTNDWNPVHEIQNPLYGIQVLDSLMWCKQSPWNHTYMTVLCNAYSSNDLHGTNAVCYHQWIRSQVVSSLTWHVVDQLHYVIHKSIKADHY